jgi:uncharacterized protein YcfJ
MMKKLLITASLIAATATPALADKQAVSDAYINDHYKTVVEQTPYRVEVCRDVQVPVQGKKEFDANSAIIGGIIGGVVGNQFGKGDGKDAMTGIGAMTGAIIAGQKEGTVAYRTERQCSIETRYKEESKRVYSHSTVRFNFEGQRYELKFQK